MKTNRGRHLATMCSSDGGPSLSGTCGSDLAHTSTPTLSSPVTSPKGKSSMAVEEIIARLREESDRLQKDLVAGTLMLVDLAGSTAYKAAHPQEVWLPR